MGAKRKTNMKNGISLLIVESPAKIKTLSKFLGKNFKIMSTFGHVKDLPTKKLGVTQNEKTKAFDLEYVPIAKKGEVIADICKQARKSSEIYLASDPDREGEIISWHIGEEIKKVFPDESKIHRIVFNEITESAVMKAIQNKSHVDMNMVNAQQARRVLDRWVGYEVSPILWKKLAKGLSAGRVQSVALLLICNREEEVISFKAEESWSIHAIFLLKSTSQLPAELFKISKKVFKLKNKKDAEKTLADVKNQKYAISKITEKKRKKKPQPPFMTSTLQQDAYNKLGFSVDRTMSIAQRLYEGLPLGNKDEPEALITYMRTDSLRVSDTALKAVRSFIKKSYGSNFCPGKSNFYGKKGAQDAHEAIRPINLAITPEKSVQYLKPEQAKLYSLIWKRFVASQMTEAEYFQRQVLLEGGKYTFKATGSSLIFDGFLKVYQVEDEETRKSTQIPKDIKEKDPVNIEKLDKKQHFTQPPPRFTQASLVKELEKKGVGRPSTYAAILSTILKRGYVETEKKRFSPTELGKAVNEMLTTNLPDIINVTFTAKMEEDLDQIAQGNVKRDKLLQDFWTEFKKDLDAFGGKQVSRKNVETDLKCPKCKKMLYVRFGKAGEFVGCSAFPDCKFTSNFTKDDKGKITLVEAEGPEVSDLICPKCGKNLVKKIGKYGPFFSCPGYPDCKYIHQEKLDMPCPACKSDLVKRRWRGGTFWGCSGYPKCRFSIFGDPIIKPCEKCKLPYMLIIKDKSGKEKYVCSSKECVSAAKSK